MDSLISLYLSENQYYLSRSLYSCIIYIINRKFCVPGIPTFIIIYKNLWEDQVIMKCQKSYRTITENPCVDRKSLEKIHQRLDRSFHHRRSNLTESNLFRIKSRTQRTDRVDRLVEFVRVCSCPITASLFLTLASRFFRQRILTVY